MEYHSMPSTSHKYEVVVPVPDSATLFHQCKQRLSMGISSRIQSPMNRRIISSSYRLQTHSIYVPVPNDKQWIAWDPAALGLSVSHRVQPPLGIRYMIHGNSLNSPLPPHGESAAQPRTGNSSPEPAAGRVPLPINSSAISSSDFLWRSWTAVAQSLTTCYNRSVRRTAGYNREPQNIPSSAQHSSTSS